MDDVIDVLMEPGARAYNLQQRLIEFAVNRTDVLEKMPSTRVANHLVGQAVRSITSPALNYGEAQAAEPKRDFMHKMKICLKELRETQVALTILYRKRYLIDADEQLLKAVMQECKELIAIFATSIKTAERNLAQEGKG